MESWWSWGLGRWGLSGAAWEMGWLGWGMPLRPMTADVPRLLRWVALDVRPRFWARDESSSSSWYSSSASSSSSLSLSSPRVPRLLETPRLVDPFGRPRFALLLWVDRRLATPILLLFLFFATPEVFGPLLFLGCAGFRDRGPPRDVLDGWARLRFGGGFEA